MSTVTYAEDVSDNGGPMGSEKVNNSAVWKQSRRLLRQWVALNVLFSANTTALLLVNLTIVKHIH